MERLVQASETTSLEKKLYLLQSDGVTFTMQESSIKDYWKVRYLELQV